MVSMCKFTSHGGFVRYCILIWGLDVLRPVREGIYLVERVLLRHAQIVKGRRVLLGLQFATDSYGQADLTLVFLGPESAHME